MLIELVFEFIGSHENEGEKDILLGLRRQNTRECVMFTISEADLSTFVVALTQEGQNIPVLHRAFISVMQESGHTLEQYLMTGADDDNTVEGVLSLRIGERVLSVPCRPSDGVLLAMLAKAPIRMADDLFAIMQPHEIPESTSVSTPPHDAESSEWADFFSRWEDLPEA